jgi:hypothetical protein
VPRHVPRASPIARSITSGVIGQRRHVLPLTRCLTPLTAGIILAPDLRETKERVRRERVKNEKWKRHDCWNFYRFAHARGNCGHCLATGSNLVDFKCPGIGGCGFNQCGDRSGYGRVKREWGEMRVIVFAAVMLIAGASAEGAAAGSACTQSAFLFAKLAVASINCNFQASKSLAFYADMAKHFCGSGPASSWPGTKTGAMAFYTELGARGRTVVCGRISKEMTDLEGSER